MRGAHQLLRSSRRVQRLTQGLFNTSSGVGMGTDQSGSLLIPGRGRRVDQYKVSTAIENSSTQGLKPQQIADVSNFRLLCTDITTTSCLISL